MAEIDIRIKVPDQAHLDPSFLDPEEYAEEIIDAYNAALRADGSSDSQIELVGSEWADRDTMAKQEARRLRDVLRNHPRSEYVRMTRGNAEFVIEALLGKL